MCVCACFRLVNLLNAHVGLGMHCCDYVYVCLVCTEIVCVCVCLCACVRLCVFVFVQ